MTPKRKREGCCVMCGTWRKNLQRDHIVPKFKGGSDVSSNIQYLCANCHEDKTTIERPEWNRRPCTPETKVKISAANKGHAVSIQTREKISHAARAGLASPEMRKRLSDNQKRVAASHGYVHPFAGKTHSLETRQKLSRIGKQRVAEFGVPFKGCKHSAETKSAISKARREYEERKELYRGA